MLLFIIGKNFVLGSCFSCAMKREHVDLLYSLLKDIHYSRLSGQGLNSFVKLCIQITENYLRFHNKPIVHNLSAEGLTLTDIAIECISSFFRLDDKNRPRSVVNFLKLFDDDIENADRVKLFIRFTKYLEKMAQRYIIFIESIYFPEPAKIRREIKYQVKKGGLFTVKHEIFGTVLYPLHMEINFELPMMTLEEFYRIMDNKSTKCINVPTILQYLHDRLEAITNIRRAVLLEDMVRFLENRVETITDFPIFDNGFCHTEILDFEMEQTISFIDRLVTEKILNNYIKKGITVQEAEALKKSCMDILTDLIKTGSNANYYEYFTVYSALPRPDFDMRIRGKLDYLIRLAKGILYEHFFVPDF
ncbi:MAG: hypothetical protein HYV28_09755 [Ignavibacteriales bacterium]|nr:hypothetical protein [Ignavibacteriales bacterium]